MQFWSAGSAAAGPHSSPSAAGNSSNPTSAYGTLRQARRAACPAAAGRVDGRTRRRPAMRRGPARILTCFRGRVLARHITCRAEHLVVGCEGPADASAGGGLKCAMADITAFMSCGARAAAAYVRCSPSRGAEKNLRKWAARKTVPGPGPGAGGEEGCGRGAGVFIKARNAHPRPGSRLPRRRARGFSHISAFSRSTRAFAHSKEEGGGRATVSRQRGL
jgi:hypothetical protein